MDRTRYLYILLGKDYLKFDKGCFDLRKRFNPRVKKGERDEKGMVL